VCDNCASELTGWFKAQASGMHVFMVASDDNGHLYFGPSENTAERIALVPGYTSPRQFDKFPEQRSGPMMLVADDYYYMKAISNDGGGGDNLAVAVLLPDGVVLAPIPISESGVDYVYASAVDPPPPPLQPGAMECPDCTPGLSYRRWEEIADGAGDILEDPGYLDRVGGQPAAEDVFRCECHSWPIQIS
jgi:hypothetical protein